jgi:hypothetical protein
MVWPFKRRVPNGENSSTRQQQQAPEQQQQRIEFRLSRYIIIGAFVFIGVMLVVHFVTLQSVIIRPNTRINDTNSLIDKVDTSNQTIFNILLPIFGAWVGVVVAFYFSTEQAKRAQETLREQAISTHETLIKALSRDEQRLANITVEQSLNQYPSAKNVSTVTLKDTLTKVLESFGDFSNIVVLNEPGGHLLGVLYKSDLLEIEDVKKQDITEPQNTDNIILDTIIEKITKEFVTKKKWDKSGINNYAKLQNNTSLLEAKSLMGQISDKVNDVLGIVIETGKVIGVITYDMILAYQR